MSTESVRQFLLAISTDSALQEKLTAVTDSVNFVQMVQESGYSFTLEDLQAHLAQHNGDELSEDELEAVTGGIQLSSAAGGNQYIPIPVQYIAIPVLVPVPVPVPWPDLSFPPGLGPLG
jgi:predicted ribosomally synthesized peptide with nif11-like leader